MKILYSHRINSHDGQGVHIEELVRALRQAGHEVTIVGPSFYDAAQFGAESTTIARLRRLLPGPLGELAELAYNIPAYRRLHAAWRSFQPDIVYERCNLYFLAGAWLARRHGVRLLLEVNSPLADERRKHGNLRLAALARRLEAYTWRSATHVLPVTHVLAEILTRAGVDPARITVIPNGIDLARFPPRAASPDSQTVTLGFVGFVRAWHGLDHVISGMAAGPTHTTLTIVGEGPAIPDLQALATSLGIAHRIAFTGLLQPAEVAATVATFDIALQPSATPYASPLKIFDYMAAACAIAAPDQPNIREILTHEKNALLFTPDQPTALWTAVERLIANPTLRQSLGTAARTQLESANHTWSGNAARVTALADTP